MTSVYSGGLVYEYSLEENGFGIVKIPYPHAPAVEEQDGFARLARALAANPAPQGDGGFAYPSHAAACPTKSSDWPVGTSLLPATPEKAKKASPLHAHVVSRNGS